MCDCDDEPDYSRLAKEDPEGFRLLTEYWAARAEHNMKLLKLMSKKGAIRFDVNRGVPEPSPVDVARGKLVRHMCDGVLDKFLKGSGK